MLRDWIESIAARVSHYNRTRKYAYFMERLNPSPEATLLDVGFTNHESDEPIDQSPFAKRGLEDLPRGGCRTDCDQG